MCKESLDEFIEELLSKRNIQPYSIFYYKKDNEDLLSTFIDFMASRCIIRHAFGFSGANVYVFSKPGREIMEDKIKRMVFVEEFLKFYKYG